MKTTRVILNQDQFQRRFPKPHKEILFGDSGKKLKWVCFGVENNHQPHTSAEALACLHVVQMGLDLRHSEVEIEGDALAIVKKINANVEDGSIISAFIKDLKALSEGHRRCHFWRRKNDRPIRRTNFDRRKAVTVPDLVYMGRDDGSFKGLL
ncbi:hypothetical protein Gotri_002517, partial [Gossypium trilobum]|nr:hypothetical protein [Gossypium trilobum]